MRYAHQHPEGSSNLRSKLADSGAKQPVAVCLAPTVAERRHGRSMAGVAKQRSHALASLIHKLGIKI